MVTETKMCQNCKQQFVIAPDDFDFYEKIRVPPPTFCPRCRLQRRLAFFNLTNLYKRPCDLCKKDSISMYPPEVPYNVYCPRCWWSDNWDPHEYGRDYDFSRPFFEQWNDLLHTVPLLGLSIDLQASRESPYNNHCGHIKNCYLLFWAAYTEDSAYGFYVMHDKLVFNSSAIYLSELCYDSVHAYRDSRCIGINHTNESLDCIFTRDCINCQNCFASANLRNKKYYMFNKPYTKEEYFKELRKHDLGSYKVYERVKCEAEEHWKNFPPKPHWDELSVNSSGNYVFRSKNCKQCFEAADVENGAYLFLVGEPPVKDCYDISGWGDNMQLCYEGCVIGEQVANLRFCWEAGINLYNAEYCKLSTGGSNHFGCVSMKKGDFVILNKKYTESEFKDLRARIMRHMSKAPYVSRRANGKEQIFYKYGEFFPAELSPSPYNETVAQEFFPIKKGEAFRKGYSWRDQTRGEYAITKPSGELPDHIKDAPNAVLNEVISCASCSRGYKLIAIELDFYRKMNVPIPRNCPFCRVGGKFKRWIQDLRLFERVCSECGSKFETPYTKEEAQRILCKQCWLAEVV